VLNLTGGLWWPELQRRGVDGEFGGGAEAALDRSSWGRRCRGSPGLLIHGEDPRRPCGSAEGVSLA